VVAMSLSVAGLYAVGKGVMALRSHVMTQPMQLRTVDESQQRTAKAAGLAYIVSLAFIAYVNFGIHSRLFSGDPPNYGLVDAEATSRNILADLPLFRLSIALLLSYCVGVVIVLAAFYLILRPFGQTIAMIAAACRVLLAAAWAMGTAQLFDAMRLLTAGSDLGAFSQNQLRALASLTPSVFWDHYYVAMFFWGLSTSLFSYLWLKSGFIPRAFAAFGVVSGALATLCALAYIAYWNTPAFENFWALFDTPLVIFEIGLSVLLLVKPLVKAPEHAVDSPWPSRSSQRTSEPVE
jgi:Domain of unknown function (DUF4386)